MLNKRTFTLATNRFLFFSLIFLSIFTYTFAKFADELLEKELFKFDVMVMDWVQAWINPQLTWIMKFFTFIGSVNTIIFLVILSSILMVWQKKKWEALFLFFASAGGGLFNQLLKWIFQRQRPNVLRLIDVSGYSFPSGHAMGSIIFFGMIGYFLILFVEKKNIKIGIGILAALVIFMIGLSRVYLGVHYPSDVLAGFAAGGAWLLVSLIGLRIIVDLRNEKNK
ncbi:phosphatase PAP2 family protein [Aquibacillus sp. 3ASR75-11]|uniref:Phosphatase PAP2 family protein n=1 Tax=Terrihalobacillus insolitus TaxID=2950438 RepID=A0A9X3WQY4_9BACI|nr:phosphatase PAP2 family protein [Terrihalobacillus insolitus]MDC3414726.1 phosphatase PAP2 family protein [Terrihalobacillus insolitus]MDC3424160.1 phosphatase PAP2 family protein [Terrihalobacillus insolitus]